MSEHMARGGGMPNMQGYFGGMGGLGNYAQLNTAAFAQMHAHGGLGAFGFPFGGGMPPFQDPAALQHFAGGGDAGGAGLGDHRNSSQHGPHAPQPAHTNPPQQPQPQQHHGAAPQNAAPQAAPPVLHGSQAPQQGAQPGPHLGPPEGSEGPNNRASAPGNHVSIGAQPQDGSGPLETNSGQQAHGHIAPDTNWAVPLQSAGPYGVQASPTNWSINMPPNGLMQGGVGQQNSGMAQPFGGTQGLPLGQAGPANLQFPGLHGSIPSSAFASVLPLLQQGANAGAAMPAPAPPPPADMHVLNTASGTSLCGCSQSECAQLTSQAPCRAAVPHAGGTMLAHEQKLADHAYMRTY